MTTRDKFLLGLVIVLVICHLLFVKPAWIANNVDPAPISDSAYNAFRITPYGWQDRQYDTTSKKDSSKYLEY